MPPPAASAITRRWGWVVAGLAAMIVIAIATRGGSSPGAAAPAASGAIAAPAEGPAVPANGQIVVTPPAVAQTDRHAGNDWNKVVDKIYERDYPEALHRLDQWEGAYGASEETEALRPQLEALAQQPVEYDEGGGRGRGRGKGKKHGGE